MLLMLVVVMMVELARALTVVPRRYGTNGEAQFPVLKQLLCLLSLNRSWKGSAGPNQGQGLAQADAGGGWRSAVAVS